MPKAAWTAEMVRAALSTATTNASSEGGGTGEGGREVQEKKARFSFTVSQQLYLATPYISFFGLLCRQREQR